MPEQRYESADKPKRCPACGSTKVAEGGCACCFGSTIAAENDGSDGKDGSDGRGTKLSAVGAPLTAPRSPPPLRDHSRP